MKYMLTLFSEEGDWGEVTPEQMREGLKLWEGLESEMRAAGVHIAGEGLQESTNATTVRIGEGDERMVVDGPFAETKEQLGGFYLIDCEDLDAAIEWARKIPLTSGAIEVRPVMDYSQFGADVGTDAGSSAGASS